MNLAKQTTPTTTTTTTVPEDEPNVNVEEEAPTRPLYTGPKPTIDILKPVSVIDQPINAPQMVDWEKEYNNI
jgi:hypothetical protein